ncbi:MAG: mechanosensitive ion channel domain-containing protein [Candidatus Eisenbacteria bacterium]
MLLLALIVPAIASAQVPAGGAPTAEAALDTLASALLGADALPVAADSSAVLHVDPVAALAGIRDWSRVLTVAGLALLYTLIAWTLLRLVLRAGRGWRLWLVRAFRAQFGAVKVRGFEVFSVSQAARAVTAVLGRLDVLAGLLLAYAWLTAVFSLLPWTQGWSGELVHFATHRMFETVMSMWRALPGLLTVAVIVVVFRGVMWLSDRFFDAAASGALEVAHLHPELAVPSKRLARIVLWLTAAAMSFPHLPGAQSRTIRGAALLLGLMASLGSSSFVGNIIGGIVLTYSRAFRVGDRVRLGEYFGDILSLGFLSTKLRTLRNEEVTIPNGHAASLPVTNHTRLAETEGLILHTEVTIGYDADWRTVHALLIEAAGQVSGLLGEPVPRVYQRSLNDHHVSYELNVFTRQSHPQLQLYSDLHAAIQDAFARAGIEILSPVYHALRDANAPVLPDEPVGPRAEPWSFRVSRGGPGPDAR